MKFRLSFLLAAIILLAPSFAAAQTLTKTDVIAATNLYRAENGIDLLKADQKLNAIAQKKAEDMAARGYYSHNTPEGKTPWTWLKAGGYYYLAAGENLALDYSDASSLAEAWMNSPKHRQNMLKPRYTAIGIGVAKGIWEGREVNYIVQLFAEPYVPALAKAKNQKARL